MRWFFRLFVLLLLLVPAGLIAVAVLCLEPSPLVEDKVRLSVANIDRAKLLLREHDPRKLRTDEVKTVSMNEEELNLVANHLMNRLGTGAAALEMKDAWLGFVATLDVSKLVPGRYLNVETVLTTEEGRPQLQQLRIGAVSFPPALIEAVAAFGLEHLYRASSVSDAEEVFRAVEIKPKRMDITYRWKEAIADAVRDRIVSPEDRLKLAAYNAFLVSEIVRQGPSLSFVSLTEATFRYAGERSADGDQVAENRAAIIVIAAYVDGRSLAALAPEAVDWVKPKRVKLRIHGRRDFVQHFTTSAALAVTGGGAVSDAIGLFKEIDDADGGSGFSFKDLTADKSGTRFGEVAIASSASAGRLQQSIAEGIDDSALIPDVSGLEEHLSDAEFESRYGGIGGAKYDSVVRDINRRIDASLLYR
ncbi:MAG: hypothetical protein QF609_04300 [Gammaproteobacteria bacterium]|nr:hypothetical protein [Gammaproteobacteria bacterium]